MPITDRMVRSGDGAKNFQCWGVLLIWIIVGEGPTALAVGVGGLDIFLSSIISLYVLPLWERWPNID